MLIRLFVSDNVQGDGESVDSHSRTSQSDSLTSKPAPSSENEATLDNFELELIYNHFLCAHHYWDSQFTTICTLDVFFLLIYKIELKLLYCSKVFIGLHYYLTYLSFEKYHEVKAFRFSKINFLYNGFNSICVASSTKYRQSTAEIIC